MAKISYLYYPSRNAYGLTYRMPDVGDYIKYQQGLLSKLRYSKPKRVWVKGKDGDIQTLRKVLNVVADLEKMLVEIDKKIWVPQHIEIEKAPKHIDVCLNDFLSSLKVIESTRNFYLKAVSNFLGFLKGSYPKVKLIGQLKEEHLQEFALYGKEKGWGAKFLYENMAFLKRFTREYCMVENDYLLSDPFRKIKLSRPNKYVNRRQSLTKSELKQYVEIFKEELSGKYNHHAQVALLLPFCGLRRQEIINLKWSNIKEYKGQVYIAPGVSKSDKGIVRPAVLRKEAISFLPVKPKEAKSSDYIFPEACRTTEGNNTYKFIKRRLKKHGLGEHCLHSLRHTYGTNLLKDGMRLEYVKEALGHTNTSTTEIYLHSTVADVAKEMQRIDG